jgi:hypothetical protein
MGEGSAESLGSAENFSGERGMALTTFQVEQAGTGKPKALGIGRHHDGGGLYVDVCGATSKSWFGRYTLNGKEIWRGIGPVKDIPLKRARELHTENRRLVTEGIDPKEHREAQKIAAAVAAAKLVTFAEAGERFITSHEAGWRNPKHRQQWRNTLTTYVYPVIGELPVQAIDTGLAMKILTSIWTVKPETASRVRGRCERVWAAARAQKLCGGENPFDWKTLKHLLPAKKKVRAVKHHAAVPYHEIPTLMEKLRARVSVSAKALEFTILCASRPGEVVHARGSEFDLANGKRKIPDARMKGGREHTVMLSKRAVEIIRELHPDGLSPTS